MNPDTLSHNIAAWAQALDYRRAPANVRAVLGTILLYNLTMGISVDTATDKLGGILATIAAHSGKARLLNGDRPRSAPDAAFINAGLITARGQNDTNPDTVTHIGCIVVPAVFALADEHSSELDDVLAALLTGYEVIPRLGASISDRGSQRGFRATPVYGVVGAAVAGARLLRLSVAETAHAISIATQLASGTMQTWIDGSDEWRLQVANASRHAVEAVLLARAGMIGSDHALEGESGFITAYSGGTLRFDVTGYRLPEMTFKPYPGCAFNQGPVHALRQCLRHHAIVPEKILGITVRMNEADATYPGVHAYGPFSSRSGAIMSLPFMIAATLRDGRPNIAHFEHEYERGALHALSRMVSIEATPGINRWCCIVDVELSGNTVYSFDFLKPRPFVFSREDVTEILLGVVQEWPFLDSGRKFGTLAAATRGLDVLDNYETLAARVFSLAR